MQKVFKSKSKECDQESWNNLLLAMVVQQIQCNLKNTCCEKSHPLGNEAGRALVGAFCFLQRWSTSWLSARFAGGIAIALQTRQKELVRASSTIDKAEASAIDRPAPGTGASSLVSSRSHLFSIAPAPRPRTPWKNETSELSPKDIWIYLHHLLHFDRPYNGSETSWTLSLGPFLSKWTSGSVFSHCSSWFLCCRIHDDRPIHDFDPRESRAWKAMMMNQAQEVNFEKVGEDYV